LHYFSAGAESLFASEVRFFVLRTEISANLPLKVLLVAGRAFFVDHGANFKVMKAASLAAPSFLLSGATSFGAPG